MFNRRAIPTLVRVLACERAPSMATVDVDRGVRSTFSHQCTSKRSKSFRAGQTRSVFHSFRLSLAEATDSSRKCDCLAECVRPIIIVT